MQYEVRIMFENGEELRKVAIKKPHLSEVHKNILIIDTKVGEWIWLNYDRIAIVQINKLGE